MLIILTSVTLVLLHVAIVLTIYGQPGHATKYWAYGFIGTCVATALVDVLLIGRGIFHALSS